jgi:hypothetical protein
MTVMDEGFGTSVRKVDDQTLDVRVTINPNLSTVASVPPAIQDIKYHFKLVANNAGATIQDEKDSGVRHALWRMPDDIARYGSRDTGGDNWCSRGTYNWLSSNKSLITSIDDVSGEHARYIGHSTHAYGTDIDMYHFYRFPGAVSGGQNYEKLVADTRLAIQATPEGLAAKQRVIAWVNATRTGLANLAANGSVSQLFYVLGSPANGLSSGWARDLLKTGQTTVGTQVLNLSLGTWTNTKYIPRADHNDHVHITLNRSLIDN